MNFLQIGKSDPLRVFNVAHNHIDEVDIEYIKDIVIG